MKNNKRFFIFLSLAIALIDGLFVGANYFYTRNSFKTTLQEDSQNDYAVYKTVLQSTYNGLAMQATLFASDQRIQELFLQGKKALEQEGGFTAKDHPNKGRGGEKTAAIRKQLYQLVAGPWQIATEKFDVRQLHFHLGPGSLSFLRVHKPKKFGDRMDDLRFIIVDTNAERTPRSGFETGRIYSGLRSVVPVFAWDSELQKKVYVGALEVGTSYKKLLETIDQNMNIGLSVLLNNQHIKNTVWDEFITGHYNNNTISGCNCILEASSRADQKAFLEHIAKTINSENQLRRADGRARIIQFNQHYYAYTFHPLRDYIGSKTPSRGYIGAVFIARDIDQQMAAYTEAQWFNLLYGIIAFILIEILLFITFLKVTRHLSTQVRLQIRELSAQKHIIELDKLRYKNLADAINDNYFFYARDKDNIFTYVSPSVTHVLGYAEEDFLADPVKLMPDNAHKEFVLQQALQTFSKKRNRFEIEVINQSGRIQYLLATETAKYIDSNHELQVEGIALDISHSRQEKMLLQLRCHVLLLSSEKHAFDHILHALASGIEAIIPDISCAIMLLEQPQNILKLSAAPSLTPEFKKVIEVLNITIANNASAIAALTVKRKIIANVRQSNEIYNYQQIFKHTPYRACCSEPVLSEDARVLATVDFYYTRAGVPSESDLQVISNAADLIATLFKVA